MVLIGDCTIQHDTCWVSRHCMPCAACKEGAEAFKRRMRLMEGGERGKEVVESGGECGGGCCRVGDRGGEERDGEKGSW